MADAIVRGEVSWPGLLKEQKQGFRMSNTMDQVRLHSGDGFTVSLPSQLLLASSELARRILVPRESGHDIVIPSVKGSSLLLLVEILRSGVSKDLVGIKNNVNNTLLDELRDSMGLLEIVGYVEVTTVAMSAQNIPTVVPPNSENSEELPSVVKPVAVNILRISDNIIAEVVENAKVSTSEKYFNMNNEYLSSSNKSIDGNSNDTSECPICKQVVKNKNCLSKHILLKHKDQTFPCQECGKNFISEDNLKVHLSAHKKKGEMLAVCDHCAANFTSQDQLNKHIKKYHKEMTFSCKDCDMFFLTMTRLDRHVINNHSENLFQCNECQASFSTESKVKIHKKMVHSGIRHACPICGSTFSSKWGLLRHAKNAHSVI